MKKLMVQLVLMVLCLGIMVSFLVWVNLRFPILEPEAAIPADIGSRAYALTGLTADDKGTYRLTLRSDAPSEGLTLVLAAMRPFSVSVNGKTLYTYTEHSPYVRVHTIPLDIASGQMTITLHSPSGQQWLKVLLTTQARSGFLRGLALVIGCVSVGIHLMILFTCLTLYLQKRSESYLLAQFSVALVSLCACLLTTGFGDLPVSEVAYVLIQRFVNSALMPSGTAICLLLVPGFAPKRRRGLLLAVLTAFPVMLCAMALELSMVSEMIAWALFFLGCLALARALCNKMPFAPFLTACYLLCQALRTYSQLTNLGYLPSTELLVYFYLPPLRSLVLLFACTLVVNHRFARKFSEAEELVAELYEANATLDAKVAQRTGELLEQQEQRRSMMVNIFHDLRSPLFSARGCADMMTAATAEDRECLEVIRERLDFLGGLTEELFLLAKLEDGKITFAQAEVPLGALCAQVAESAALEAERSGVAFTLDAPEPLFVVGDGFRLKQALENLLQNALKFTPAGGRVALSLIRDGDDALLQVKDTGKGIPAQDLPHVFERYYQGKNTDKQRSTGLGLSIAREIVRAHGGTIGVESAPGAGTCFSIRLTLAATS